MSECLKSVGGQDWIESYASASASRQRSCSTALRRTWMYALSAIGTQYVERELAHRGGSVTQANSGSFAPGKSIEATRPAPSEARLDEMACIARS